MSNLPVLMFRCPSAMCPCAKKAGNMSVLCECHDRMTGEPNICLVAGPYWPIMMFW